MKILELFNEQELKIELDEEGIPSSLRKALDRKPMPQRYRVFDSKGEEVTVVQGPMKTKSSIEAFEKRVRDKFIYTNPPYTVVDTKTNKVERIIEEIELFNEQELKIEPDPFGNNRRARRKAELRAKAKLAKKNAIPTVNPKTGRISQQGSVTIDRNIDLDEPYNKPIPDDPGFGIAPKDKPKYTPKAPKVNLKKSDGVTIRRPKNLGSDW